MPKISRTYDHGNGNFTVTGVDKGGLIVHKGTSTQPSRGWRVAHVQSGYAASPWLDLRRKAIALRDALLPLGDWTRTKDALTADKPFLEVVRNVILNVK
jgi:hypothetical protein